MSNEYLKTEYERRPNCWQVQVYYQSWGWLDSSHQVGPEVFDTHPGFVRLKPHLPGNLPEPPEQAYCLGPDQPGGVFLYGQIRLPQNVHSFKGWILGINNKEWFYSAGRVGTIHAIYIIDLSDPNAGAIIDLNRPEAKTYVYPHYEAKPQGTRNTLTIGGITLDLSDPQIHDALRDAGWCHQEGLVADGWTPPDNHADEWVRLGYVDFELQDPPGTRGASWYGIGGTDAPEKAFIYALKYGASAVRIRRKQKQDKKRSERPIHQFADDPARGY